MAGHGVLVRDTHVRSGSPSDKVPKPLRAGPVRRKDGCHHGFTVCRLLRDSAQQTHERARGARIAEARCRTGVLKKAWRDDVHTVECHAERPTEGGDTNVLDVSVCGQYVPRRASEKTSRNLVDVLQDQRDPRASFVRRTRTLTRGRIQPLEVEYVMRRVWQGLRTRRVDVHHRAMSPND